MNLSEIANVINVRNYVFNSINSPNIDRNTVNMLSGMLILLDKKIINLLTQDDFKEFIGYSDVKKAIEEVAKLNNIKSGLKV